MDKYIQIQLKELYVQFLTKFILQKKLKKSELTFKHYFLDQLIETQKQDLQQRIAITKLSLGSLYIHNVSFHFAFEHLKKHKTVMQCFFEWR